MQRTLLAPATPPILACIVVGFATLLAVPALGADPIVENQARALQKKAIEEDSLNINYAEAIKKLTSAIGKCGADKCNAALRGALYRDLGAMLILNGSVDDGRAAFAWALGLDSSLDLDPSYKNKLLETLWNDAKKKPAVAGGGAGGPIAGAAADASLPTGGGSEQPVSRDFAHLPAGAQLVRTPLPIYAEYLGTEKLLRVVVKYRSAGMTDWKALELRKIGAGYGGVIPCTDIAEGKVHYYIQGYGTTDDAVAASGSRVIPYSIPIKSELSEPAPSLPGQDPPKQCAKTTDGNDCPPDFPGCRAPKRAPGEECTKNGECETGSCAGGKCANDAACESDEQCSSGACRDGTCGENVPRKSNPPSVRRIWIGVAGSLDILSIPGAENVCVHTSGGTATLNTAGYQCVDPSTGVNFPGTGGLANDNIKQGSAANASDAVAGGASPANLRLLLSFDYALGMNVLLGARVGYVLFTDPASAPGAAFAPIHIEARATFLLGADALARTVAPMLLAAVGAGEFDATIAVTVQMKTGESKNENAWLTAGPMFAAAGAGVRFLLGPTMAATLAVKGEGAFGGAAGFLFGIAPEVGIQLGL